MTWRGWSGAQWEDGFWPLLGQQMRQEVPRVLTKPEAQSVEGERAHAQRFALCIIWNQSRSKTAESSLGIYSAIDTGGREEDLYIETPVNTNGK